MHALCQAVTMAERVVTGEGWGGRADGRLDAVCRSSRSAPLCPLCPPTPLARPGSPASGAAASGTPGAHWPRTWAASSDWSARVGASSLAESVRRSAFAAGPVVEAQAEGAAAFGSPSSSLPPAGSGAVASVSGGRHDSAAGPAAAGAAPSRLRQRAPSAAHATGDLEESLLYDYDGGEEAEQQQRHHQQQQRRERRQDEEDERQAQAHGPRPPHVRAPRGSNGGDLRFELRPAAGGGWETTPFQAAAGAAPLTPPGSARLARAGHSYMVARRELSGAGSALQPPPPPPPGSARAAAAGALSPAGTGGALEGGFREPFVVHVEQARAWCRRGPGTRAVGGCTAASQGVRGWPAWHRGGAAAGGPARPPSAGGAVRGDPRAPSPGRAPQEAPTSSTPQTFFNAVNLLWVALPPP
jgi:hypothetical protein